MLKNIVTRMQMMIRRKIEGNLMRIEVTFRDQSKITMRLRPDTFYALYNALDEMKSQYEGKDTE